MLRIESLWNDFPKKQVEKRIFGTISLFSSTLIETEARESKQRQTTRSQEATKNVTTNAIGVAQATNPLITVATYVAVFLTVLPIGLFGFVQVLRTQPGVARTTVLTAEADEAATELTAAERRAQRKAAREAAREGKTKTNAAEPEVTVEVVNPIFNGFDMQNADFGTMQTPFAGGFGMMPMPPFGGFPGFGAMQPTDANGFPGFGLMPNAEGFIGFNQMPNADENTFNGFGAGFGNF